MNLEEVVKHFAAPSRQQNGSYKCKCPAHDDKQASLHISQKPDGRIVFQCLAGCDPTKVIRAVGLSYADLKPQGNERRFFTAVERVEYSMRKKYGYKAKLTFYIYRNKEGVEVYRKLRIDPEDGKKECRYVRILENATGKYKWGAPSERVLYRLPETIMAISEGKIIFIPEGEKCVDALTERGFTATTAGSAKDWRKKFAEVFRGADVVLLPDNDEAGIKLMKQIRTDLTGVAKSIKTVMVMPETPKGDVADFFQSGKTAEDFKARVDSVQWEGKADSTLVELDAKSQMGKAVTITKDESGFCLEESRPGKPKPSIGNFVAILENDQTLKNSIALNELSMLPEIVKPMPWTRYQRTISDDDLAQLRSRCEEYGISNKDNLTAAVSIVANRHAFHPLRQLLESLEWDGEDRISDLFPRYLGAARSKYTETVTRIFLHGAIERAYFPGAKLDNVLVLTGGQGIGKSSLCRFLALEDVFFTDDIPTLEGKQAIESIQGRWICELGENTAMLNARNIETIKSFVSRQTDICRLAYERYVRTMNRTAVFVITSNRTDPLPPDRSGHRRFLPLRCGDSPEVHPMDDIDATKDYCRQVMAQALYEWRNGEKMLLVPKEMVVEVEEERNDFTPEDTTAGLVRDYLNGCDEDRICTLQLFYEALKYDAERDHPQKWQLRELSEIMNSMPGWRRVNSTHRFPDYGIQKYWQRIRTADSFGDAVGDVPFL